MEPESSTVVSPVKVLICRMVTFLCLLIKVIILVNLAKITESYSMSIPSFSESSSQTFEFNFAETYVYRYMLASGVIGLVYTTPQIVVSCCRMKSGRREGKCTIHFDFYADLVLSYILGTGFSTGFGFTINMSYGSDSSTGTGRIQSSTNSAAGLLLAGFISSAISVIFSALSLPMSG